MVEPRIGFIARRAGLPFNLFLDLSAEYTVWQLADVGLSLVVIVSGYFLLEATIYGQYTPAWCWWLRLRVWTNAILGALRVVNQRLPKVSSANTAMDSKLPVKGHNPKTMPH